MRYNGVFESQKMNQVNNGGVKNPTVLPVQSFVCGAFGRQFYVFLWGLCGQITQSFFVLIVQRFNKGG